MMFKQQPLPYSSDALSPFLSKEAIETHHNCEGANNVSRLNMMVAASPLGRTSNLTLEEVMLNTTGDMSNNACQVFNHDMYFQSMCPVKQGQKNEPSGLVLEMIKNNFETLDNFEQQFVAIANNIFGSGYCWLVMDPHTAILKIMTTENAENPVRLTNNMVTPLICCDVWEHAYYIDYKEKRMQYLQQFVKHINWKNVNDLLATSAKSMKSCRQMMNL
eukprot:Rmarinus@m.5